MRTRRRLFSCGVVLLLLEAAILASPVANARDDDASVLSAEIDRLVAARWDENGVTPAPWPTTPSSSAAWRST